MQKEINEQKNEIFLLKYSINKLKNEININNNKLNEINENNTKLKNEINENNTKLKNDINENNTKLNDIKNVLNELKLKIDNCSLGSNNFNEQILAIQIISEDRKVNYCIPCKKNDNFVRLEELLYKEYPKLSEKDNYFMFNDNKINRFKTFDENGLKSGDKVILFSNE